MDDSNRNESKNLPVLLEFVVYCTAHPEERFWQALRNWSGYPAILTGKSITALSGFGYEADLDTFYFEGKNDSRKSD